MVSASDGSLWILDGGRGRVIRVDGADGTTAVRFFDAGSLAPVDVNHLN